MTVPPKLNIIEWSRCYEMPDCDPLHATMQKGSEDRESILNRTLGYRKEIAAHFTQYSYK